MYVYRDRGGNVRLSDGEALKNVQPLSEEFYDREETGPMFTAEVDGINGVFHLFDDEIEEV